MLVNVFYLFPNISHGKRGDYTISQAEMRIAFCKEEKGISICTPIFPALKKIVSKDGAVS